MYQSIYYNFKDHNIYLRDDISGWSSHEYKPTYYNRVPKYVEGAFPVLTGGYATPTKRYEKDNPHQLEKDIDKELAFLRDNYYKNDESIPTWHNILYLDIEIEMGGALTVQYIKEASKPFTSISMIDATTKTKICFVIDKENLIQDINQDGKIIISCKTEKELILKFIDKFTEFDPTILVGWNSTYFDIPYLYYRICNVLDHETACLLSPIREINIQTWNPTVNNVKIAGINHLDYYLLFKKYITKEEPSYKLGAIGEKYVELGKIEYEGNLDQLFKNDINKYIEYNIRDVEILEALEKKFKFIDLSIIICHDCLVPYESIYLTTVLNEGKILKYLKRKNIVSNNKPTTDYPELKNQGKIDYAGGFLLQPKIGLHNWGSDFDASSHYPTIIMSLNIGAETLVGWIENNDKYNCWLSLEELKEMNPNDKLTIINKQFKKTQITINKLVEYIEDNNILIAASGAMFDSSKKSILAEILEDGFNKRQEYKTIMKEAGKNKDWEKYNMYNLKSNAIKYFINGCYGALSLPSFRYSDGRMVLSKATTLTGQRITQEVIKEMNSYMLEDFNKILESEI